MGYQPYACPRCQQIDEVHKVSVLYAEGRGRAEAGMALAGGGWPPMVWEASGPAQTALSRQLSPPPRPRYRDPSFAPWARAGATLAVLLSAGLCLAGGFTPRAAPWLAAAAASLLLGLAILVRAVPARRRRQAEARAAFAAAEQAWRRQHDRWSRLYCCLRDEVVFDPQRRYEWVEIDRVMDLMED
jgi:hypothetical protein